jgi:hypothetical protein
VNREYATSEVFVAKSKAKEIIAAFGEDYSVLHELHAVLARPFEAHTGREVYTLAAVTSEPQIPHIRRGFSEEFKFISDKVQGNSPGVQEYGVLHYFHVGP